MVRGCKKGLCALISKLTRMLACGFWLAIVVACTRAMTSGHCMVMAANSRGTRKFCVYVDPISGSDYMRLFNSFKRGTRYKKMSCL